MTTTTDSPTTPKQGTSIDEALGHTEFGGWIAQNKMPVISAIVLLIVGVFAFGGYRQYSITKNNENADALYRVVNTKLASFEEGKTSAEELVNSFNSAWDSVGAFEGATPFVIQVSDALRGKKNYEQAHALVMKALKGSTTPQSKYFLLARAAVLAEDLDKKEMAIEHLKEVLAGGAKFMEGKTYLDLGRLYRETGKPEMAKTSFEWVVENGKEAEFKKVAQLYLEEL